MNINIMDRVRIKAGRLKHEEGIVQYIDRETVWDDESQIVPVTVRLDGSTVHPQYALKEETFNLSVLEKIPHTERDAENLIQSFIDSGEEEFLEEIENTQGYEHLRELLLKLKSDHYRNRTEKHYSKFKAERLEEYYKMSVNAAILWNRYDLDRQHLQLAMEKAEAAVKYLYVKMGFKLPEKESEDERTSDPF